MEVRGCRVWMGRDETEGCLRSGDDGGCLDTAKEWVEAQASLGVAWGLLTREKLSGRCWQE